MKKVALSVAVFATFAIAFSLQGAWWDDIGNAFKSAGNWIKGAAETVGQGFKTAGEETGKFFKETVYEKGLKVAGEAVFQAVIKPTYEKLLEPAYHIAVKPFYEVVLKPAIDPLYKEVLKPVGTFFEDTVYKKGLKVAGEAFYHTVLQPTGNFFEKTVYESGLKIAGNAVFQAVIKPAGTFFKETVFEEGLKKGFYQTVLVNTIYEKGLKEIAKAGTKDFYVKTIYEQFLRDTIYQKGLVENVYEKGLKGAVYETFLRDWVYKVGLNWVGEHIIVATLVKVIMPTIQFTMNAIGKIAEWTTTAYHAAFEPWVGPIFESVLKPVLKDVAWDKAIGPLLKFANDDIIKPTLGGIAKVLNPLLEPLLAPLKELQRVLGNAATDLNTTKDYIQGLPKYETSYIKGNVMLDAQGNKMVMVDKDGFPIPDPKNPSLPERMVDIVGPVYSIVEKFSGAEEQDPTQKTVNFVDLIGKVIITIHETRKQIKTLQTQLAQEVKDMTPEDKKIFKDALTQLDTDLKGLANTATLAEQEKPGYQRIRPADQTKKIESVFCPEQDGGVVCQIAYHGIAAKLGFDANLVNLNKALEKLGLDINAGSDSCILCSTAMISNKDCTFPLRLELASAQLNEIVNKVIKEFIEAVTNMDVAKFAEIIVEHTVFKALPPSIQNTLSNVKHGLGK